MSSPDYSQAVKDIIDGLGESPTPDAIYHAVRSYSVDHVVAAAAAAAKDGGGGASVPLTLDPVDLTGRTFSALGALEPQVVWAYDGDQTLSAAITGYLPNAALRMPADDDLSTTAHGYTDENGDLTLTINNIGFDDGDGPDFSTHIHTPSGLFGDVRTLRTLSVGTPYAATESYRLGVFAAYVAGTGPNIAGNETVTRGAASFYSDGTFGIPLRVIAADGQAVSLLTVYAADGTTELFGIGNDGTPAFHGAGVPQVPATPGPQDVVDALVALGLVTQAS